jgi:hypothetical protein
MKQFSFFLVAAVALPLLWSRLSNGCSTAASHPRCARPSFTPCPPRCYPFPLFTPHHQASSSALPLSPLFLTPPPGITVAQRELLTPALLALGATFSPNLDERCTHLIVPSIGGSDCASSSKVLACRQEPLLHYVWVVTSAWLAASQAQGFRAAERQFQPAGTAPPTYSSADSWLGSIAREHELQQQHVPREIPLFGRNGLIALPPSSLFLDDEPHQNIPQKKKSVRKSKQQQQPGETPSLPSKTRGWWVDESSVAHIMQPLLPLPYVGVAELMSLSSSDAQPTSQDAAVLPSSQVDYPAEALEDDSHSSPLAGTKAASQSPASSMSASRTSQGKRRDSRPASDSVIAAADDVYCVVASLMDER